MTLLTEAWLFHPPVQLLVNGRSRSTVSDSDSRDYLKKQDGSPPGTPVFPRLSLLIIFLTLLSSEGKLFTPWTSSSEVAMLPVGTSLFF